MASQADCASYDIKESDWGAGCGGRVGEMSGCVRTEWRMKDRKVQCHWKRWNPNNILSHSMQKNKQEVTDFSLLHFVLHYVLRIICAECFLRHFPSYLIAVAV